MTCVLFFLQYGKERFHEYSCYEGAVTPEKYLIVDKYGNHKTGWADISPAGRLSARAPVPNLPV
jgi:hypothetical protein